jgi:hypothetical protein
MIEHTRRHGPFDPRFPRRTPRTTSASTRVAAATPDLVRAADSAEDAQRGADVVAALQTWEGEGGASEHPETHHTIEACAPRALEVYLGSVNGRSFGVCWEGTELAYESFEPGYQGSQQVRLSPSQAQWRRFWRSMDQIGVWDWATRYEPGERFEPRSVVRDGTHWSLTLANADRAVESSGDNASPDACDLDESRVFPRLCEAVARLVGGREFA